MSNEANVFKEKSKDNFNNTAYEYSTSHDGKFVKPMYDEVIERVLKLNTKNLLDVGCGTGIILEMIRDKDSNIKLYGLDISEKMIEVASNNVGKSAELKVGDAEFMPWKDKSFQAILCNASFHHYPNPLNVLKEMNRLLVEGGTLIIGDPTAPNVIRFLLNKANKNSKGGDYWIYNEKEIKDLLIQAGFEPKNFKKINHQSFIINAVKK